MSRTDRFRLLRKFAVLLVLLAGFAVASSDVSPQAGAAPCCSSCEQQEAECYTLPDPEPCVEEVFRRCWRWCSFSC